MLELQNISYLVDDDNKEILRDINLAFDEKFVAIDVYKRQASNK